MPDSVLSRRDFLLRSVCGAGMLIVPGLIGRSKAFALSGPPVKVPGGTMPCIALIIDDVGFSVDRVAPFLQLKVPLTFSVLPHLPYSRQLAEKIHDQGHEIMLHQPMEPHNMFIDPGPGALFVSQSPDAVLQIIERNIAGIPHAVGCNNHMGSRYTELRHNMGAALASFKERGFFFVDSITSQRSVAYATAKTMAMGAAQRNVFIDNVRDKQYVYAQLVSLKKHALRFGSGIGIGHPRPETVAALKRFLPEIKHAGVCLAYASQLARNAAA